MKLPVVSVPTFCVNRIRSCHRWSLFVPFFVYLLLLTVVKFIAVPLRSGLYEIDENNDVHSSIFIQEVAERSIQVASVDEAENKKPGPQDILEEIFHKADEDKDDFLSTLELGEWINTKTQEHIHSAIVENYSIFTSIDIHPRNGVITWEEYHAYFLRNNGLSREYINKHSERHKELSRSLKESIMRDRAAWSEAARTDPDSLTLDEFLAFRHPESSHATILSLVEELFDKFDRDGDEILTEDEFSTLQSDDSERRLIMTQEENDRRVEFRDVIDKDSDGKASRQELLMYIDPKNPRHAKEEAETLVVLADVDHDGKLSLNEVFNKMDLFLGSKMVDTAKSFHDEF